MDDDLQKINCFLNLYNYEQNFVNKKLLKCNIIACIFEIVKNVQCSHVLFTIPKSEEEKLLSFSSEIKIILLIS